MTRLPANLEAAALIRGAQAAGGFAAVVQKGEPDSGTILVVLYENGANGRFYERMPQADGSRAWHCARSEDPNDKQQFNHYIVRRAEQDRDAWIIELDVADGERLIGLDQRPT